MRRLKRPTPTSTTIIPQQTSQASHITAKYRVPKVSQAVALAIEEAAPRRPGRRREIHITPEAAAEEMNNLMRKRWAAGTVRERASLMQRLNAWSRERLGVDAAEAGGDAAALFVLAARDKPQGRLAAAKALAAHSTHMGWDARPLRALSSALRASGAGIPEHQSAPIPAQALRELVNIADRNEVPRVAFTLFLAWACCSRWSDVSRLGPVSFLYMGPRTVDGCQKIIFVVDFWRTPKGRGANPFVPSRYAVLSGANAAEATRRLQALGPWIGELSWSTDDLDRELRRVGSAYRAHSIKRGAYQHVLMQSNRLPRSEKPDEMYISRLLKHKHPSDPPSTTMTYGADAESVNARIEQALALGTHMVSPLLDLTAAG